MGRSTIGALAGLAIALAGPAMAADAALRTAPSLPAISPDRTMIEGATAGGVHVELQSTGDPDEDAALSADRDAHRQGILAIKDHEAALLRVMADMPTPFNRQSSKDGQLIYRADSMQDCLAFAGQQIAGKAGSPKGFVCKGNPFPTAAFYLGSYYNELGRAADALAVLDKGLIAAPDAPLLITERNGALIGLGRVAEILPAADRGLRIPNLSDDDRARLLRNRGYALTELHRLDEAEQAYKDSLALQPDSTLARNELVYIARLKAGGPVAPGGVISNEGPKK